jgi:glycerol-3-phosphate O-acyltransferase
MSSITLPLWLLAPLVLLAALALWDHLARPLVRWWLVRTEGRVLDQINTRLHVRVQPFRLTARRVLIERLRFDPEVLEAERAWAEEAGASSVAAAARTETFAREIVPSFSAYAYFRVGYWISKTVARALYRVRLSYQDEAALAAVDPYSTVVFVMNHRSNMDYVLVAYLAAERAALSYAVGEWARIWPLESLIRSMGAYFVRRSSGDAHYRRVLERYVAMATRAGVTQAMYPEGGLSRDGSLRPPKLGLLAYMLRGYEPVGSRDIVFVPVGLNYDRTLEDRTLLRDLDPNRERRSPLAAAGTTLRFVARNFRLLAASRWYRFGYACATFGSPISVKAWSAGRRVDWAALQTDETAFRSAVADLGHDLMEAVGKAVPVVPVAVVAAELLEATHPLAAIELKARVFERIERLETSGAHVHIPRRDLDYTLDVGLRMLVMRRLVVVDEEERLAVAAADRPLLEYYARSIGHL